MEVGRELGAEPGSGVPGNLKPGSGAVDLGAPVELRSVLRGMVSAADAEDARQLDEGLRRRAADQELRDELARHDFGGSRYHRFREELARYGTAVLRACPTDAELEELHRDSDARDDLANMTVAVALPRFRDRALAGGSWRADGGAALPT